jgi:hypothetical protein
MITFSTWGGEFGSWVADFTTSLEKDYLLLDYLTNLNWAPLHEGVILSYGWLSKIYLPRLSTINSASFGDLCLVSDTVLKTLGRSLQMAVCLAEFNRWVWAFCCHLLKWGLAMRRQVLGEREEPVIEPRLQWVVCNWVRIARKALQPLQPAHKTRFIVKKKKVKCHKTLVYR